MKGLLPEDSSSLLTDAPLTVATMARQKCASVYLKVLLVGIPLVMFGFWWLAPSIHDPVFPSDILEEKVVLSAVSPFAQARDVNCTYHNFTCIEVYNCGHDDSTIVSVYIYPIQQFFDELGNDITPPMSREFAEMLQVIAESPYHSHDPITACLFIPSVDLLNENLINPSHVSQILASLKWWNEGKNHLLVNMLAGRAPDFQNLLDVNTSKAMVAGAGFSSITYRRTFDVTIPIYNSLVEHVDLHAGTFTDKKKWFLMSAQLGLNYEYKNRLKLLADINSEVMVLDRCGSQGFNYSLRCDFLGKEHSYPQVLQNATFCLVMRGKRLGQPSFLDTLKANCIPVVVADEYLLPFHEVLDWTRAAVRINEEQLPDILEILRKFSPKRIESMRKQLHYFWQRYFSSLADITLTMLQIVNDRVFPYNAKSDDQWNELPNKRAIHNPLFLPLRAPKALGFTVVILTFNRVDSLFQVVRQVGKVPSLAKVIVVWNNQDIQPPPMSKWPAIGKPIKVIQTKYNRLSNRFFPYDEIETECIFAIDDDIIMLTPDEMEFGYEVWREHPDRLVGYPSRLHLWQNESQSYSYESEWMNSISMVLTGAAFHHKYFSFMYTYGMPGNLRQWVDEHINCEDIAMNFLVTNITGKAPIKVVPRKKFKCPECAEVMLSASSGHMVERSGCITLFMKLYGSLPLKAVEFRADPVLFKDKLPGVLKKYNDLGLL